MKEKGSVARIISHNHDNIDSLSLNTIALVFGIKVKIFEKPLFGQNLIVSNRTFSIVINIFYNLYYDYNQDILFYTDLKNIVQKSH